MANGYGESVGRVVGPRYGREVQEGLHHLLYCRLSALPYEVIACLTCKGVYSVTSIPAL